MAIVRFIDPADEAIGPGQRVQARDVVDAEKLQLVAGEFRQSGDMGELVHAVG